MKLCGTVPGAQWVLSAGFHFLSFFWFVAIQFVSCELLFCSSLL